MSVRVGDRTPGKLEVLNVVRMMCIYSLKKCNNEKIFPKRQRWLLTNKIAQEAIDTFSCVRRANSIYVQTAEDYRMRRSLQVEAGSHLVALLGLVDLAYNLLAIDSSCIEHWTSLIVNAQNKVSAWTRSDYSRYNGLQ